MKKIIPALVLLLSCMSLSHAISDTVAIVTGVLVGCGGHMALDYMSVQAHEYGHAIANKLLTGDPIKTNVRFHPLKLICSGTAYFKTELEPKKDIIRTIAGPLTGLAATQLQLSLLDYAEKNCTSITDRSIAFTPFASLKSMYDDASKGSRLIREDENSPSSPVSIAKVALKTAKLLRTTKMIGEALYGFLPVSLEPSQAERGAKGDGEIIWQHLLNRKKHEDVPALPWWTLAAAGGAWGALLGTRWRTANERNYNQRLQAVANRLTQLTRR